MVYYKIQDEATKEEGFVKFNYGLSRAESALFARILIQAKEGEGDFAKKMEVALDTMFTEAGVRGDIASSPYAGSFNM